MIKGIFWTEQTLKESSKMTGQGRMFIFSAIFILASLYYLSGLVVVVEAGSKSSKASTKTTVIAIDGGGGGGKPHPVPVPWPVVHCHHHHHHLKYVPKPVLVHHWVKKGKLVEDYAASNQLLVDAPKQYVQEQPEVLQMPHGGSQPALIEQPAHLESTTGFNSAGAELNPAELAQAVAASELGGASERPYALASAQRPSAGGGLGDLGPLYSVLGELGAQALNGTGLGRSSSTGAGQNSSSSMAMALKPSHPFKGGPLVDQLRDESKFQAKIKRLNQREQTEARRSFERFASEQAQRMAAIDSFNGGLHSPSMMQAPHRSQHPPNLPVAGSPVPSTINSRASSMSESRAIELVTKLAEQMAQAEARKMLLKAAAVAAQTKKKNHHQQQQQHHQQQAPRRSGGLLMSLFNSNSNGGEPSGKHRRRASGTPSSSLASPAVGASPRRPASDPADQLATEASNQRGQLAEPAPPPGGATEATLPASSTAAAVGVSTTATPPPASSPQPAAVGVSAATTTTTTTMSPEQESQFYLGQQLYSAAGINSLASQAGGDYEFVVAPLIGAGSRRPPRAPTGTSFNWQQASDLHKLVAEPPRPLLNNSGLLQASESELGGGGETAASGLEPHQPQIYLRDLDPFSAHSYASLVAKTPHEAALEQQQQQLYPHLASPYLEFPLTPEKWSSEALRQVNGLGELEGGEPSAGDQLPPGLHFQPGNSASLQQASSDAMNTNFDPMRPASQQVDPQMVSAAADFGQLRQFQQNLGQQPQLFQGGLALNQLNSTTGGGDMTRLSRQVRDQMRTLQGRLPQMPQMPNIPQPPNLPQPPQLPNQLMQMAGMALPFALARATRSNRQHQAEQVNAAAQGGGAAGGPPGPLGVRQRLFNRALTLTNRFARPRPRRPAPAPSSSSASSSSSSRPAGNRNPRHNRWLGAVRTIVDLSRRPPGAARRPQVATIRPKIDQASPLARFRFGRALGAASSALDARLLNREQQQQQRTKVEQPIYLPSSAVMATLGDGSLAAFPSMTSPADLFSHQVADWPRVSAAAARLPQQVQQPAMDSVELEPISGLQQPPAPAPAQTQEPQNQSARLLVGSAYRELAEPNQHLMISSPPLPLSDNELKFAQFHRRRPVSMSTSGGAGHHRHSHQQKQPLVANHINLLLITAQNVTQGASLGSGVQQQQPAVAGKTSPEVEQQPEQQVHQQQEQQQVDQQQVEPQQETTTAGAQEDQQVAQQPGDRQQQQDAAGQPSMLAPVAVRRPPFQSTRSPTALTNQRPTSATTTTKAATTTTATTTTARATPTTRREWAGPEEYVRAIRLVRGLAYPWPPPTRSALAAVRAGGQVWLSRAAR